MWGLGLMMLTVGVCGLSCYTDSTRRSLTLRCTASYPNTRIDIKAYTRHTSKWCKDHVFRLDSSSTNIHFRPFHFQCQFRFRLRRCVGAQRQCKRVRMGYTLAVPRREKAPYRPAFTHTSTMGTHCHEPCLWSVGASSAQSGMQVRSSSSHV